MKNLKVDKVVETDREAVCTLARLTHEQSLFADIPFSEGKFYSALDNTIENPDTYLGLKVSIGDEIIGFCYAVLGGYYIGEGAKIVTVITIATAPKIRSSMLGGKAALRLTRAIEIWANSMKASYVLYHATSGINPTSTDRFFRKLGMTALGGNYGVRIMGQNKVGG